MNGLYFAYRQQEEDGVAVEVYHPKSLGIGGNIDERIYQPDHFVVLSATSLRCFISHVTSLFYQPEFSNILEILWLWICQPEVFGFRGHMRVLWG